MERIGVIRFVHFSAFKLNSEVEIRPRYCKWCLWWGWVLHLICLPYILLVDTDRTKDFHDCMKITEAFTTSTNIINDTKAKWSHCNEINGLQLWTQTNQNVQVKIVWAPWMTENIQFKTGYMQKHTQYRPYFDTHLGWSERVVHFLICTGISTDRKNMNKIRMSQLENDFANWETEGKKWPRQRSEAGWVCEQREKKWPKQLIKCL